jgi:AraC-like DNA-binding protein
MSGDRAAWTRVEKIQGTPLDLLEASFERHHYAPHAHAEWSIGACTDGVEVIRYNGGRHRSGRGSIVVVEPGETHTGGPAGPDGYAYRAFYPACELLPAGLHFGGPIFHDPELAGELLRTHRLLGAGGDLLTAESRLIAVLGALAVRHARPGAPHDLTGVNGGGAIARTVMERLADQAADPPTLAALATELGLSRYQVLRAFRDTVGMPPYAWLAQHRVARARVLLDQGIRPATAATAVGFADQAHLTRWFRRVLGVTPGAYRNSVQDTVRLRP